MNLGPVTPILRMYDVEVTRRFYVDYLGCAWDWQDGEGDRPVYAQVSRDGMTLHLSSHHDDGTPGTAVIVETADVRGLWEELRGTQLPVPEPRLRRRWAGRCARDVPDRPGLEPAALLRATAQ